MFDELLICLVNISIISIILSPYTLFILHVVDIGNGPAIVHVAIDIDLAGSILLHSIINNKIHENIANCP